MGLKTVPFDIPVHLCYPLQCSFYSKLDFYTYILTCPIICICFFLECPGNSVFNLLFILYMYLIASFSVS
jgi:hypothetical protein